MDNTENIYDYENNNMNYIDNESIIEALQLIKEAVEGEKEDYIFYNQLMEMAPTEEEKGILGLIRDDEMKHNAYFRQIYEDFTDITLQPQTNVQYKKIKNYLDGIKKALFGELRAVEKYRKIRAAMPNTFYRDILFEIITDELKHSGKYNYIFTLNH